MFPTWFRATLFVAAAVLAYLGTQTSVQFNGVAALIIGALEVGVAALLSFQQAVTRTVRRLQGRGPSR